MDRSDSCSLAPLQPNHPKSDGLLAGEVQQASNETCSRRFIGLLDGNPRSHVGEDAYILQKRNTVGLRGRFVAGSSIPIVANFRQRTAS